MQTANLAFIIDQARDQRQDSPIGKAVASSVEVGIVVPSVLRSRLKAAGFKVTDDEATATKLGFAKLAYLTRVLVVDKKGAIVAMGASSDADDALLHAMLGWFRENALPGAAIPAGVGTLPAGS